MAIAETPQQDHDAIVATAEDYILGFYDGDGERMEGAIHWNLAKRIIRTGADGEQVVDHMGGLRLVQRTKAKAAGDPYTGARRADVQVLAVTGRAATAKVEADKWVDYLHLGKFGDDWRIVNVLWELR